MAWGEGLALAISANWSLMGRTGEKVSGGACQ